MTVDRPSQLRAVAGAVGLDRKAARAHLAGVVAADLAIDLAAPLRAASDRLALSVDLIDRHVALSTGPSPYPWKALGTLRQDLAAIGPKKQGSRVGMCSHLGDACSLLGYGWQARHSHQARTYVPGTHTSSMATMRSYQPLSRRICGTFGSSTRSEIVNVPVCAGCQA